MQLTSKGWESERANVLGLGESEREAVILTVVMAWLGLATGLLTRPIRQIARQMILRHIYQSRSPPTHLPQMPLKVVRKGYIKLNYLYPLYGIFRGGTAY